ncbi:hypothetical protein CHLRE_15g642000v5 [Chlamydomonas reinhardtii]|uniref:Uncharacterized protein n=1 Tax=Chlamydomonas reinhardtii TaxID=3055 RepID=A0A2K3CWX9_CHLRE|nr:uncharacterized protein CHLRE_15g642000v5 [Chlamydomonas reinhardtii]PNW72781.1 hypothetical protein CHLRE_15g642000v5 [Chlamydomonas reinhardtii]
MSTAAAQTALAGSAAGGGAALADATAERQQQQRLQHLGAGDNEPSAELAAASYRAADENEMLAALKAEAKARTISYHSDTGGHDPPRNSPPSLASGAFGKYAAAVAANRHMSPLAVMSGVKVPAAQDALPGEEEVAARLASEAAAAYEAEKAAGGGAVPRAGVASKLQSAADKYARMVAMDKEALPSPGGGSGGGGSSGGGGGGGSADRGRGQQVEQGR